MNDDHSQKKNNETPKSVFHFRILARVMAIILIIYILFPALVIYPCYLFNKNVSSPDLTSFARAIMAPHQFVANRWKLYEDWLLYQSHFLGM